MSCLPDLKIWLVAVHRRLRPQEPQTTGAILSDCLSTNEGHGCSCHGQNHLGNAFVARHNGCEVTIRVPAQLRQCEVLRQEDEAGKELTGEEQGKLGMMSEWKQRLAQLEG